MEGYGQARSSMFVAPLQITKRDTASTTSASIQSPAREDSRPSSQPKSTDPRQQSVTNRSERASTIRQEDHTQVKAESQDVVFHNYLRASYAFHATGEVSPDTVTLPLEKGDIVMVHSVHANGWADGTRLDDCTRGWLPTNHCESYDLPQMQHLLKAFTDFWDTIHGGSSSTLAIFENLDYIRGLIAGVRYLLESTNCRTRDSDIIKGHDNIRRNRKALLSELTSILKIAKRLQDLARGAVPEGPVDNILDEILLTALKIVTRAVRFLDDWMAEVQLPNVIAESIAGKPDPPASVEKYGTCATEIAPVRVQKSHSSTPQSSTADQIDSLTTLPSPSIPAKRASISHRISYKASVSTKRNSNYASERLGSAHDHFLGLLGAFIGLHMQSRSSGELMGTTQSSIKACRRLLTIVHEISECDNHRCSALRDSRDDMYQKITDLVYAARAAFTPSQGEEIFYMSGDGKPLMEAATACVRAAGDCVMKARLVLERRGDFEMDVVGLGITNLDMSDSSCMGLNESETSTVTPASEAGSAPDVACRLSLLPPAPPHLIEDSPLSATPSLSDGFTHSTTDGLSDTMTDRSSVHSTVPPLVSIVTPQSSFDSHSPTEPYQKHDFVPQRPHKQSFASTRSNGTRLSSMRYSETSGYSLTSTRATSFDYQQPSDTYNPKAATDSFEDMEEVEARLLETTFAHEIILNKDGQVIGGTLRALIERLTAFQSTPDAIFVSTFYLTFRLFATPMEFATALIDRFNYIRESPQTAGPVRLRVYNIFKGWLESHWRHDVDIPALNDILRFALTNLYEYLPSAGKRLAELAEKVSTANGPLVPRLVSSIGKTNTSIASYISPEVPLPSPIITKNQMNTLKAWKNGKASLDIWEFDPLELARQLTLKASRLFCSVLPEELLATEWTKKSGSLAVNVRAMSTLSTDLTNLVADSILQFEEPKRRAQVIKCWVKIANKCLELNNYDSLIAIVSALNMSTIARLKRTWEIVSQKTKHTLDSLRAILDVSKNYAVLRQRLQNHVAPCLPFVGIYLTHLTFVDHGNQATRQLIPTTGAKAQPIPVINFDKHMKTAKIISELQRFQIPYRITEVPELQAWMQDQLIRVRSAGDQSFQNHYRRSLVLEPREIRPSASSSISVAGSTTSDSKSTIRDNPSREKFDFFQWTHSSHSHSNSQGSGSGLKDKANPGLSPPTIASTH